MRDNIEKMAREYREALRTVSTDDGSVVERIITLEENQLDYLNALSLRVSPTARRNVNYLKSVVYRILQRLNALLKNDGYVPSFRNTNVPCSALVPVLLNTQTSIFSLYDELSYPYETVAELLSYENRKAAILALFA